MPKPKAKAKAKPQKAMPMSEWEPLDMTILEEAKPAPAEAKAPSGAQACDDCSCCHWSPHKGHVLWTVVMLLLVFFAGVACTYMIQEWDLLESEIESVNNSEVSRIRGDVAPEETTAGMTPLTAPAPYYIQYPEGWHVFGYQEEDANTKTITSYAAFKRLPFSNPNGAFAGGNSQDADIQIIDYVAKDEVDQQLIVSENTVHFRTEEYGVTGSYRVYRAIEPVEAFNQPENAPYLPLYKYVISYQGFGPADGPEYHVLVATVVTQDSPGGLIAPEDTKAVLDSMIKTFVPPSQLSTL